MHMQQPFKPIHYLKAVETSRNTSMNALTPNLVHEFIKSQENPLLLKEDIFPASQKVFRHILIQIQGGKSSQAKRF